MGRAVEYKARVKNRKLDDGTEITVIRFRIPLAKRVGAERVLIQANGNGIKFTPTETSEQGTYKCKDIIRIRGDNLPMNLRQFNGEYSAFVKDGDSFWLLKEHMSSFTNEYKRRKDEAEEVSSDGKKESPYTKHNPYLKNTSTVAALRGVIYGQDDRIRQLNEDIEEARKLLEELTAERDRLAEIQQKAEDIIQYLGGK